MSKIIQLKNVSKSYDGKKVVDGATLTIENGKIYGFVGPNGAGKTTIMKMITNLVNHDSGEIFVFGEKLKPGDYEYFKRVGNLIENPSFYENLTTRKNLELFCEYKGYYNKEEIEKILEVLDLKKYEKVKFKNLSLGNKQRLGIAQAIVTKPELVILDEPINGLDPIAIKEVRELFIKLKKEYGITLFISSHILSEMEHIADIICFINNGKILEETTMEALKEKCGAFIELAIENSRKASLVLDNKMGIKNYKIMDECVLRIYEPDLRINEILDVLLKEHIEVLGVGKRAESLEEYYVKKIGGVNNV
ncbi:MAG: ABC transporter ATP-binding protein [Clostridium sp.]